MDRRAAKELLHIQGWLIRANEVVERGKAADMLTTSRDGSKQEVRLGLAKQNLDGRAQCVVDAIGDIGQGYFTRGHSIVFVRPHVQVRGASVSCFVSWM